MDADEKTPQERLDENPELVAKLDEAAAHPELATPRTARHTEDFLPPEYRPHRW